MTQHARPDTGGLKPGDLVAGYEICERIAAGGMAVVYRANDTRLGRPVAVKVLAPRLSQDDAFRQRFIRESRAAAGVDHPHIVPVFDAGESDGVLFIAMRYVGGGDVRSLLEAGGPLNPVRAAAIASQIAAALDAAHACGLVHRDVKPGNILLGQASDGHDHAYLSDFGLSKQALASQTLTATGEFMGTLDYVAPEQIQGHRLDGRADQYGLACTVVEMLTGSPPFRDSKSKDLMWAQLESAPPRVTERRPGLSPLIDEVVSRALAKGPAGRYATCRDFAVGLASACAAPPGPASALDHTVPPGSLAASVMPPQALLPRPRPPAETRADLAQPPAAPLPAATTGFAPPPARRGRDSRRPARPTGPPAGRPPAPPRAGYGKAVAAASAVAAIAVICAGGVVAYQLTSQSRPAAAAQRPVTSGPAAGAAAPGSTPPVSTAPGTAPAGAPVPDTQAVEVLRAYVDAINDRDYSKAWVLSGEQSPNTEQSFARGLADTEHDKLQILAAHDNVVNAQLDATQTDGSTRTYVGTYTVAGDHISSSSVRRIR